MNQPLSGETLLATVRDAELRRCISVCASAQNDADRDLALRGLISVLQSAPLALWQRTAVEMANSGLVICATALLHEILQRWPDSAEARHALVEILWRSGDVAGAEGLLEGSELATRDAHLALQLARIRRNQGRFEGAAAALKAAAGATWSDNVLLDALQFLKQCQHEAQALEWCERELQRGRSDSRLYATAGNLAMGLGRFELARERFQQALAQSIDLNTWYVPQALANCQRYADPNHPDRALFVMLRETPGLDARARASLDFAMAKLAEESGDIASAAVAFRSANALLRSTAPWSRDAWLRQIEERMAQPFDATKSLPPTDFRPLFVVGLPRTGTTLVAERLARHAQVRSRGEPPLLQFIARQFGTLGARVDRAALQQAANMYMSQMRQDDGAAPWYLDKDPLNFRYLDVAAKLFPQARVVICQRQPRDTAVSIWTQYFAHPDYAFSCDFSDIRVVHDSATALMQHWQATLPLQMLSLDYERMVDDTAAVDAQLAQFLDLPALTPDEADAPREGTITSASLWQARQPVYRNSLGRGERFAEFLPELRAAFP